MKVKYLVKRALSMPKPLMLFSFAPWCVMTLFFCSSLAPRFQADVFGIVVSRSEWWASGCGTLVTIGLILFTAQALLVIYQVRLATPLVGGVWVVFAFAEFTIGPSLSENVLGEPMRDEWALIASASMVIGAIAYLFAHFSPTHRAYLGVDKLTPSI